LKECVVRQVNVAVAVQVSNGAALAIDGDTGKGLTTDVD
jgi:hypothetical protein